jgi:hypothetical protein
LNEWTAIAGDKRLGLLMGGGGGPVPVYPATQAALLAAAGFTASWLALYDEASGDVLDKVGANNLPAGGSPTYSNVIDGRSTIYYDAAGDFHRADVNDPGSSSFIAGGVVSIVASVDFAGLLGRSNVGGDPQWVGYYRSATGNLDFRFRDDGANQLVLSTTTPPALIRTGLCLVMIQCDRTAGVARARVSGGGRNLAALSGSIAGWGSFTGASQSFAVGNMLGTLNGTAAAYGFYGTGAQAEGANTLAGIARGLGWE